MDVFRANAAGAFSMMEMTATVIDLPHKPMRIGQLGLFNSSGVRTTEVSIERQSNTLVLVQTTPRGGPGVQNTKDDRSLVKVPTARISMEEAVKADEVQGIRALGSESELRSFVDEVRARQQRMSDSIETTIEFQRIGALKGLVLDADGSTLLDLFATFSVTAQTEVGFDLTNATPASGALRTAVSGVLRLIEDALGGLSYDGALSMCSSQFFDAFVAHPEFRAYQLANPLAINLSLRTARRAVEFAGVTWEEYRGQVGSVKYVADDKAHIFPTGVPDLFLTRYAPAEWAETVNTIGLPMYSRMAFDNRFNSKVDVVVQSQLLNICTRPRVLIPARKGA